MTTEAQFRASLLDAKAPIPPGLTDGAGRRAGRRYAVYRNNVAVSLTEAIETGFPAIASLLGADNMQRVAGAFIRQEQPRTPILSQYGAGFPAFLAAQDQLSHLPYLADVARLELALRAAYHAADADPLAPERLAALPPERLMAARLTIAPAVRALASPWPILDIWRRNAVPGAPKPGTGPQEVLVTRPGFDPEALALPPGGAAFVTALQAGATVAAALEAAPEGVDLATIFTALLQGGAITEIRETP